MLRLLWILQMLLVLVVLANASGSSKTHSHRYLLSPYRAQHNPRTQMDYKRSASAKSKDQAEVSNDTPHFGTSKEPIVRLTKSGRKVQLHFLMVRLYQHNKFICMGTIISEKLVITASTCFDEGGNDLVSMKMYNDKVLDGHKIPVNRTFLKGADPLLIAIELNTAPPNSSVLGDTVKLCDTELQNYSPVELPLWIRSRHSIHSQITYVKPIQECRHRLKDPRGVVATGSMICARNMKYTAKCQNAVGNPLIYREEICGINVAGHNCPAFTGVDLYIRVYDALEFSIKGMEIIKSSHIEDTIL
ncbi:seminase [Drosophila takahashii]|uniref:seminase n=1 Tax=Drosophila takahashii TaxID=29030 RepID=UPI001CF816B0|nr:seminase [Drosophila takahashii]